MSRALAVLLVVAAAACRRAHEPEPAPAEPPAAVAPGEPVEPTPAAASGASAQAVALPTSFEAQAGGRTLAWWGDRLTTLRRDGPDDLYRLAVQRAQANGLKVNVEGERVTVAAGEAGARP